MTAQPNDRQGWTRGEWHEAARILHKANPDWTCTRIAEMLGVTCSAVWKVLHPEQARESARRDNARPERKAAKLAFDREKDRRPDVRGRCTNPICNNLRGIGHGTSKSGKRRHELRGYCQACRDAVYEVRRTLAEGMWADDWTIPEMAAALDVPKANMSVSITQWRQRGHAAGFPYRRTPEQVARIREGAMRGMGMAA